MMGAVNQLHPLMLPWLVFGFEQKEKWSWEDECVSSERKGDFTLASFCDWCPPAELLICHQRDVPLFL